MNTSILIVVSAIVILVMALVLLTIFGQGIGGVATITGAKSQCAEIGRSTCSATGMLPANWAIPTMRVKEGGQVQMRSCAYLMRDTPCGPDLASHNCILCGFPTPESIPGAS